MCVCVSFHLIDCDNGIAIFLYHFAYNSNMMFLIVLSDGNKAGPIGAKGRGIGLSKTKRIIVLFPSLRCCGGSVPYRGELLPQTAFHGLR
jgi:hypothetical protein